MRIERHKDDQLLELLKMIAPGTPLREGLENILKARTGALIVLGDSEELLSCVEGGFLINKEYSPARLYELAKMDGAIIVSKDLKTIMYANTLLIPDPSIYTEETGTRHKSAERFAKQTGEVVVCISQRRNIITLYKASRKYILKDTSAILTRANQALQTLEKYIAVLQNTSNNLSILEFEDNVTLNDVAIVIQRTEMVMRVVGEIERYICELGNEGRLLNLQLDELMADVEEDGRFVIEDYMAHHDDIDADDVLKRISTFANDELMNLTYICHALGFYKSTGASELCIYPKGFRILSKVPRLPMTIARKLIDEFGCLREISKASIEQLDEVEGIGELRARAIKEGLRRVREQVMLENRII
jgi:Predicted nucleic-acid-binding protein (contains the HHH domain)